MLRPGIQTHSSQWNPQQGRRSFGAAGAQTLGKKPQCQLQQQSHFWFSFLS